MSELYLNYRFIFYAILISVLIFFTTLVNKILLKFSTNLGTRNENVVRWTTQVKPALGGISFYMMFLLTSAGFLAYFPVVETDRFLLFVFMVVCTMGFMMGLADDAYNTRPFMKFLVQFACGFLFIYSGNYIKTSPFEWLNYTLTLLWVVGLMNSINMLDNMDGVTTLTSLGIIAGIISLLIYNGQTDSFWFAVSMGVGASLIGFMYHNRHPAVIYMGDTGSQFLGVFLAWIGVKFLWNGLDYYGEPVQAKQIIMAALLFLGPIADTTTVTINRLMRGQSPFVGGRDHTTHCLVYNGVSQGNVSLLFLAIPLLSSVIIIFLINRIYEWSLLYSILCGVYFIAVLGGLFYATKTRKSKENLSGS
ncbi:MAG: undecaprenyl/decaprenyl-phosphate alpha-N-acetylglucosaminyl 1-phosphate transferase [Flavobacteriales bacterium]|nr:undecaprenyl/decaprenyl-phosphate alpha-N-acetylglucosaminyl 1-phosphate transferase [Flavobacteriales bacterium]